MAIFVIVSQPHQNIGKLPDVIASAFPKDYMKLTQDTWLVATTGTARELSDKLDITTGANGSAVVAEIGTYYGRASNDIWEWIKTKWEATANG